MASHTVQWALLVVLLSLLGSGVKGEEFSKECKDILPNCPAYGANACKGDYEDWARENCAAYCGFCTGEPTEPPPTTTVAPADCQDVLPNCASYGGEGCVGDFEPWARTNCMQTCGFCIGFTSPPPPCEDKLDNCADFGEQTCAEPEYEAWAKENCRRFCGICTYTGPTEPTTTVAPEDCKDKIPNCEGYGEEACTGVFQSWAQKNCPQYCGFCIGLTTAPKPCMDYIPNCEQYGEETCSKKMYKPWAKKNCRRFCGFCTGPTVETKKPITTTIASSACYDYIPNCHRFGKEACKVEYRAWATQNCPYYCGFCTTLGTPEPPCTDRVDCSKFNKEHCREKDYKLWLHDNCRKFCGYCNASHTTDALSTMPLTSVTPPPVSLTPPMETPPLPVKIPTMIPLPNDKIRPARNKPQQRNRITTSSPSDLIPSKNPVPNDKGRTRRIKPQHKIKATTPKAPSKIPTMMPFSVGRTNRPEIPPTAASLDTTAVKRQPTPVLMTTRVTRAPVQVFIGPTIRPKITCTYKNQEYKEGQVWTDGCSHVCACVSGIRNGIRCIDKCPKFIPGPLCHLGARMDECCSSIVCKQRKRDAAP